LWTRCGLIDALMRRWTVDAIAYGSQAVAGVLREITPASTRLTSSGRHTETARHDAGRRPAVSICVAGVRSPLTAIVGRR